MSDNHPNESKEKATQPEPQSTAQTLRVYCNYAGMAATPEEFILRFCDRDLDDSNKATEIVRVFLSLPHAKRLVIAMARALKGYEEIFGEIKADLVTGLSEESKTKLGVKPSDTQ
jgi:hypothetical protein